VWPTSTCVSPLRIVGAAARYDSSGHFAEAAAPGIAADAVPHSGHRSRRALPCSGVARRSYPHVGHRPTARARRRARDRRTVQTKGSTALTAARLQNGTTATARRVPRLRFRRSCQAKPARSQLATVSPRAVHLHQPVVRRAGVVAPVPWAVERPRVLVRPVRQEHADLEVPPRRQDRPPAAGVSPGDLVGRPVATRPQRAGPDAQQERARGAEGEELPPHDASTFSGRAGTGPALDSPGPGRSAGPLQRSVMPFGR
jgi:hypothetical protein